MPFSHDRYFWPIRSAPMMQLITQVGGNPFRTLRVDDRAILGVDEILPLVHLFDGRLLFKIRTAADSDDARGMIDRLRGEVCAKSVVWIAFMLAGGIDDHQPLLQIGNERTHDLVGIIRVHRTPRGSPYGWVTLTSVEVNPSSPSNTS